MDYVLGGTSVAGAIAAIYYRKANKRIKDSEAKQADVNAKSAEIDYANKYFNDMLVMLEKVKEATDKGSGNQEEMMRMLQEQGKAIDDHGRLLEDIVTFLDGDFNDYLKKKNTKPKHKQKKEAAIP